MACPKYKLSIKNVQLVNSCDNTLLLMISRMIIFVRIDPCQLTLDILKKVPIHVKGKILNFKRVSPYKGLLMQEHHIQSIDLQRQELQKLTNMDKLNGALIQLPQYNECSYPYMIAMMNGYHIIDVNIEQNIAKIQGIDQNCQIIGSCGGHVIAVTRDKQIIKFLTIQI